MDVFFENQGLCHIGEKIYKNLDFQSQLACRLVRKSWNKIFVKEGLRIEFEEFQIQFQKEALEWRDFLKELKTKAPIFLLNLYLRYVLRRYFFNFFDTPLIPFSIIGNFKIVELILQMKPNNGWSLGHYYALESAAKHGHVIVAKCLKNLYRTEIPSNLSIAILFAVENGHLEILKVLMDDVTNLEEIVDGKIISAAACSGKIEMIKFFEQKLDENHFENSLAERNHNGETIFHYLSKKGHLEMLKYLCQETSRYFRHPLQKDHVQRTPIHYAAEKGHLEIVKFLAMFTSNPNSPDQFGLTPTEMAKSEGFMDIEAYLLKP